MMFKRKTLGVDSVIRQASDKEAKLKAMEEDNEELKATLDQCKIENSALKELLEDFKWEEKIILLDGHVFKGIKRRQIKV